MFGVCNTRRSLVMATAFGASLALSACGERNPSNGGEASPSPTVSQTPAQTSIMRPGIETPTFTPPPLAPLDVRIGFPEGGAKLDEQAVKALQNLVASPQVAEGGPIVLRAHSDSDGCDDANMRASKKRGEAVKEWMIAHGIIPKRITLIAFGEQNPIAPNAKPDGTPDEAGRAKNRRVEVNVAVEQASADDERAPTLVEEIEQRSDGKPSPSPSGSGTPSAQATPR